MLDIFRDFLAGKPVVFAFSRKLLELGFVKQKRMIKEVFDTSGDTKNLDIGCGTGEFAPLFKNADYHGIDIFPPYIAYAKKKNSGNFYLMEATDLSFKDETFDHILFMAILHHLQTDEVMKALVEAKRALRPRGRVLIMEGAKIEKYNGAVIKFFQTLDKGNFIRPSNEYKDMALTFFNVIHECSFRSGVCAYYALLLEK